jgi:two-component system response regulator HydG
MPRILYLEDEDNLVQFLPLVLKEKGLELVSTSSIKEALRKLAEEEFDAVLLDIMMPPTEDMAAENLDYGRKTGIEVARRMKRIKPKTPIVAFTVTTDSELLKEIKKAGAAAILHKPAEVDQIVQALEPLSRRKSQP